VKALRNHLGVTQEQFAQELGVRQQTISEWETGVYRPRGASSTLLTLLAERAGFTYSAGQQEGEKGGNGAETGPLVGCCGFPLGRREYVRRLRVVEVQQSFYRLPRVETARRWRQESPEDFVFTLKASQMITHPATSPTYRRAGFAIAPEKAGAYGFFRPTPEVQEAWRRTLETARVLRAQGVLFQCPPSFTESREHLADLRRFFEGIERDGLLLAWELRGGWRRQTIGSLCRELRLVHCVDPLAGEGPVTSPPYYLRLHGGRGYRHSYSDEEMALLLERYGQAEGYIMFNNLPMLSDATRLLKMLEERWRG
jgi:uncharacterized protein YecE (DUF72 family)